MTDFKPTDAKGNLVPEFAPMLAMSAGDLTKLTYPVIAQIKLDGIRASVVDGKLVSRTLKEIPNREIFNMLSRSEFEGLDGELIVGDPAAHGCMQSSVSFVMSRDKTGADWTYHVFDKWDVETSYFTRYHDALAIVQPRHRLEMRLEMVEGLRCEDEAALVAFEAETVAAGHEGIIVRNPSAPYKFGRSGKKGPLLKVKRFIDFEAVVLDVFEELHNGNEATKDAFGRTERSSHKANKTGKGRLGGLTVRAINGPHEGQQFNVGTGFTAAQRESLWGDDLIGAIAKVKSFPIGVKDAPRHPVWLGWRDESDM